MKTQIASTQDTAIDLPDLTRNRDALTKRIQKLEGAIGLKENKAFLGKYYRTSKKKDATFYHVTKVGAWCCEGIRLLVGKTYVRADDACWIQPVAEGLIEITRNDWIARVAEANRILINA